MWYLIVSEKFNVMMLVEDHIYTELSMRTETFGDGNAVDSTDNESLIRCQKFINNKSVDQR